MVATTRGRWECPSKEFAMVRRLNAIVPSFSFLTIQDRGECTSEGSGTDTKEDRKAAALATLIFRMLR